MALWISLLALKLYGVASVPWWLVVLPVVAPMVLISLAWVSVVVTAGLVSLNIFVHNGS